MLGSLRLKDTHTGQGAFIKLTDSSHKPVWAQAFTSQHAMSLNSLAIHQEQVFATGSFYKNAQIGSRKLTAPDRYSDAFMVILKKGGGIEGVRHFTGSDSEKVSVLSDLMGIWLYGSFRANMAALGKINTSSGRYENGFIYRIDRQ